MKTIWFDHGLSCVADAITMINDNRLPALRILASHRDPYAPALKLADSSFIEPLFDYDTVCGIEACIAWCLRVCQQHRVDIYVVQGKQRALAAHSDRFDAIGTRLLLNADAETLDVIDDKARFYRAAVSAGLPMPCTREVQDVAGFDAASAELARRGLRACIKPPKGIFGAGYWQLDDTVNAFGALMDPDDRRLPAGVARAAIEATGTTPALRLLVLEFLQGPEWSIDCLCDNGHLQAGIARLKLARVQRLAVTGPAIDLARKTIAAFSLSGLVNVQLRAAGAGAQDDLRILEVNTRMSGGCLYTAASGVNLPWWQIALACRLRTAAELPAPVGGALVAPGNVAVVVAADSGSQP